MALTPQEMRDSFEQVMNEQGTFVTFTKHTITYSGAYGEAMYQSGTTTNTTTSGLAMFQPIGPSDVQILPQGQVSLYPQKMFVHGSIDLTGDTVITANGSPYVIISSQGIIDYQVSGVVIYRKAFVRAQIGSELEYT